MDTECCYYFTLLQKQDETNHISNILKVKMRERFFSMSKRNFSIQFPYVKTYESFIFIL